MSCDLGVHDEGCLWLATQYDGQHTGMSAHYNRGKKSLALGLRAPPAREIALALADRAG